MSRWELEKSFGEMIAIAPSRSTRALAWHDPVRLQQQMDRIARRVGMRHLLLPRLQRFIDAWEEANDEVRRWSLRQWKVSCACAVETVYTPPADRDGNPARILRPRPPVEPRQPLRRG